MSLRKTFGTDKSKETEGVKVEYAPNKDGSVPTFIIARMGGANKRYAKALDVAVRPYRAMLQANRLDAEIADSVFKDVFINTCLLGWENVLAADMTGNEADEGFAQFTPAGAKQLFTNLPDLYQDLQAKAQAGSTFNEELAEESAKN